MRRCDQRIDFTKRAAVLCGELRRPLHRRREAPLRWYVYGSQAGVNSTFPRRFPQRNLKVHSGNAVFCVERRTTHTHLGAHFVQERLKPGGTLARPTKSLEERIRARSFLARRHGGLLAGPLTSEPKLAEIQAAWKAAATERERRLCALDFEQNVCAAPRPR